MDSVGQRIRKLRELRGYSQKSLAQKAGIHEISLQFYELERRHPKVEQLEKIAMALEIDIAFLQPAKTDSPLALYALLFDLVDQFGDVVMQQKGGTVLFGIDHTKHAMQNIDLSLALDAHTQLSPTEFQKWLIDNPPLFHTKKIIPTDTPSEE